MHQGEPSGAPAQFVPRLLPGHPPGDGPRGVAVAGQPPDRLDLVAVERGERLRAGRDVPVGELVGGAGDGGPEVADAGQRAEQVGGRIVVGAADDGELGGSLGHHRVAGEHQPPGVDVDGVAVGVPGGGQGADGHVAEVELGVVLHGHVEPQVLPVHGDGDRVGVHAGDDVGRGAGQLEGGAYLLEEGAAPAVHGGEVVGRAHHHPRAGGGAYPVGEADVVGVVVGEQDRRDGVDPLPDGRHRLLERRPAARMVVAGVDQDRALVGGDQEDGDGPQGAAVQGDRDRPDTVDDLRGDRHLTGPPTGGVGVAHGYGHRREAPLLWDTNIPDGRNLAQGVR